MILFLEMNGIPFRSSRFILRKIEGTRVLVSIGLFVVLLRHCHGRSPSSGWGGVGKIRASYLAFVIRAL